MWIVPYIHRSLTDESVQHRFPDIPSDHGQQIVYWEGAFYLITLALGWSNPGRGLKWWIDAGKPVDQPVLHLLKSVWDHRGQLERLAAWLWIQDQEHIAKRLREMPGVIKGYGWSDQDLGIDRAFGQEVAKRWPGDSFESTLPLSLSGG